MKLLFDHNLSPKLVARLSGEFKGSIHVVDLQMDKSTDREIWIYARDNDFLIVTKDADFGEFSLIWGIPPQIIWIRKGNCSTGEIETLLRVNLDTLNNFESEKQMGVFTLY